MDIQEKLIRLGKKFIIEYEKEHMDISINPSDVFVVWSVKCLQNSKFLMATKESDGLYFELTYNGDEDVFYIDTYYKRVHFDLDSIKENMLQV